MMQPSQSSNKASHKDRNIVIPPQSCPRGKQTFTSVGQLFFQRLSLPKSFFFFCAKYQSTRTSNNMRCRLGGVCPLHLPPGGAVRMRLDVHTVLWAERAGGGAAQGRLPGVPAESTFLRTGASIVHTHLLGTCNIHRLLIR